MRAGNNEDSRGLASPGGRFENSPPFQGWDCRVGAFRPEGTAEFLPQTGNKKKSHDIRWILPSLRDSWHPETKPGSELPGYFQISLREKENAGPNLPNPRVAVRPGQARRLPYVAEVSADKAV